jgi:predicted ATPase/transcriptional regulator with XRE-family HTH domain
MKDEGRIGQGATFGELLRQYRQAANLTQQDLADRSRLSMQAVGALERGERQRPYRTTVDLLARALGLPPAQRELFAAASRGPRAGRRQPPAGDGAVRLPTPPTPLIGRGQDVLRVCSLFTDFDARLVTLTGPAGVGKSRIGLAAASRLSTVCDADAVLVSLGSIGDPELVGGAIRAALEIPDTSRQPLVETLASALCARRVLLLMDDFEHVLPAAALVADLLVRCPELRVLATSRATLRLRAEHVVRVSPLPVPARISGGEIAESASVALFAQCARAIDSDFALTPANAALVAEICQRLDGLPLALELAAAQTGVLPLPLLLERLEDRLDALVGGTLDQPVHQRTMRGTLQWSYGMLTEGEQALFRRLAVFAGPADVAAIEAVCQAAGPLAGDIMVMIAGLIDKSLVQRESNDRELRLTMLETVRDFGDEMLRRADEYEATADAHADYYRDLVLTAESALSGAEQSSWLRRLESEYGNVRAVIALARDHDAELALQVAGRLWRFWLLSGRWREGIRWIDQLLALDAEVAPATRARALMAAGNLAWRSDWRMVRPLYEESLALYRSLGDQRWIARALNGLGLVAQKDGDHEEAIKLFEDALVHVEGLDDLQAQANCMDNLSVSLAALGDMGAALSLAERGKAIRMGMSDNLAVARSLVTMGMVQLLAREAAAASASLREAARLAGELQDDMTVALALSRLGAAAHLLGDDAEAAVHFREAMAIAGRVGATRAMALSIEGLATMASDRLEPERAAALFAAASAIWEGMGARAELGTEQLRAEVRRALGEERFQAITARARQTPLAELLRSEADP